MARPFGLDSLDRPRLVGWAIRCDDIDARVAQARAQGYDPGDPIELQRTTAQGTLLRWRLTPNALGGGPIPFLIDWGDAVHPSRSAPAGLTLLSFHLEHPQPEVLTRTLHALAAQVPIIQGPTPRLAARFDSPRGPATVGNRAGQQARPSSAWMALPPVVRPAAASQPPKDDDAASQHATSTRLRRPGHQRLLPS
jgi:hypothetical protein